MHIRLYIPPGPPLCGAPAAHTHLCKGICSQASSSWSFHSDPSSPPGVAPCSRPNRAVPTRTSTCRPQSPAGASIPPHLQKQTPVFTSLHPRSETSARFITFQGLFMKTSFGRYSCCFRALSTASCSHTAVTQSRTLH